MAPRSWAELLPRNGRSRWPFSSSNRVDFWALDDNIVDSLLLLLLVSLFVFLLILFLVVVAVVVFIALKAKLDTFAGLCEFWPTATHAKCKMTVLALKMRKNMAKHWRQRNGHRAPSSQLQDDRPRRNTPASPALCATPRQRHTQANGFICYRLLMNISSSINSTQARSKTGCGTNQTTTTSTCVLHRWVKRTITFQASLIDLYVCWL